MRHSFRTNSRRKLAQLVSLIRKMRTSRSFALFSIGVMLGASLFMLRLAIVDMRSAARSAESAPIMRTELQQYKSVTIDNKDGGTKQDEEAANRQSSSKLGKQEPNKPDEAEGAELTVRVYLTDEQRIETVPLEDYVKGVVAAEMPIGFELEALKAQAIAARTYIIRRLKLDDLSSVPDGADVTDTVQHQVYIPLDKLENKWTGKARDDNMDKLKRAAEETKGLIITYEDEPIQAAFFSTSNGYTENSEDYWQLQVPYLRSVESPWDKQLSPRYEETVELTTQELYEKLGLTGKSAKGKPSMKVIEETDGKRIKRMKVNGKEFSGREMRERLSLASSQFTWKISGSTVAITTYGYGHGVGMSQWGANGMAMEGSSAEHIIQHYYSGTSITQASKLP